MSSDTYVPTPEEQESNSWAYCLTDGIPPLGPTLAWQMPPMPQEEDHAHHQ